MPKYERSVTVNADVDKAYKFLADPLNLPRYVATMVMARPEQGERLHVAADVQGRHEEGEAMFRTDASRRRIEWGAEDESEYSGWLQVNAEGNGSTVQLHLHIPDEGNENEINRVLDGTTGNIRELLGSS